MRNSIVSNTIAVPSVRRQGGRPVAYMASQITVQNADMLALGDNKGACKFTIRLVVSDSYNARLKKTSNNKWYSTTLPDGRRVMTQTKPPITLATYLINKGWQFGDDSLSYNNGYIIMQFTFTHYPFQKNGSPGFHHLYQYLLGRFRMQHVQDLLNVTLNRVYQQWFFTMCQNPDVERNYRLHLFLHKRFDASDRMTVSEMLHIPKKTSMQRNEELLKQQSKEIQMRWQFMSRYDTLQHQFGCEPIPEGEEWYAHWQEFQESTWRIVKSDADALRYREGRFTSKLGSIKELPMENAAVREDALPKRSKQNLAQQLRALCAQHQQNGEAHTAASDDRRPRLVVRGVSVSPKSPQRLRAVNSKQNRDENSPPADYGLAIG